MAAADVDAGYIAGHLGLEQPEVITLTTEPTAELVAKLLQAVVTKAHEYDTLFADKLQVDIELENALHSSEARTQASKDTTSKALKEVEEARQTVKEEETKRQALENELQVLKAKDADHDAEVKSLNDKIEALQSSNRTNLTIIESNNKRDQTVTEELTKQHKRNVELAREVTSLQQSEQNAKGQLNSAKYREESLKQQLELARRNSEWLETELKTKSDEGLKYRKEKGARVAELQRENEDARSQVDALKRTEQQLRERLAAMQSKADEALVKLQKQEGSFANTIESYKQELEDQRRLVDMSDQLSKKHQERVGELEAEKERLSDNYENELRRVRLELEQERQATTELEERVRQLEGELDEAQARAEQTQAPPGSAPQTPRANGSFLARAASPFGTPGSIRSKSAVTATQAIEQLYQVKGQLASEKRRNHQLAEELDNMITALEAKAPEIQELQAESETLRSEVTRMSELSQQSFEERDAARKAARKAESSLATAQSEAKILRTQLRDLGTQIQMLVFNIYAMEKGMDQLTEEEKFRLEQLQKGEITEEALSDLSDTHQFITQKLVVFKDVKSLQAKNEDLMRITRELAEQLESEEALAAKHQAKEDHDRVEKLQQELEHMTEESRSIKNTMESYKMERDMFRRILQQRGSGIDEASMMRSSLDGSQRLPLASIEGGADQTEALNEALRRLQAEYDSFRDAQDGVRKDFRDQIDHLSTEKNSLHTERVKLQGELRLESERRQMLQSNYVALQGENSELQKRSQSLSETAAKQDIRTQQVAEELIEAKGLLDSMRNEAANLKAEKKLWKDIQDRMSKDNENLIEEKNRLNNLLATQQSLENERNVSESESRRKAQNKIDTLERELSDAQRKLSNEAEESKKLQLRKEYEAKEAQRRIDDLMASLSQLREEHVGAKTSRDHLQARVDELTVELRNAEERVGRLQPRQTPRPGPGDDSSSQLESEIYELKNEISDLTGDLAMANTQLENAKAQVEQYKQLSQDNEETLEDLRAAQEQFKLETDNFVAEKDSKFKELTQRVEDLSEELSRTNTEMSQLRDSQGEVARSFELEKSILQEEVDRLKQDSSRHVEAARYHQQDLRAQADIAAKAQQDYEQELVKHAEAAKLVQQLRSEYNELKSESATLRAEAESAKVTLTQSESSWEDRRQQLEQELTELTTRREDVNSQNKLLHQQLEALTSQVAALQQSRSGANEDGDESMASVNVGDALDGLRELNSYLRREKEILEVQFDLKTQESKRLQQQVDYTQSQLDEARLKLDQERTQSAQSGRASMTHQDLMDKLNELNLYRESSAALRNENGKLKEQLVEKHKRVDEMEAQVQPLNNKIENLETQKSYLEEEIKQIQEDRDRWQKRTEGILTKYGRVDPAEMDQLKKAVADLEAERNTLKEGEKPLQEKITELETTLESERQNWQETRSKMTAQFKERNRKFTGEKVEAEKRANELQEELDKLKAEALTAQQLAGDKSELELQLQNFKQQVEQLQQQAQQRETGQEPAADGQLEAQPAEAVESAQVVGQLEEQLANLRKELETVNADKLDAEQRLETLRTELQTAISERDSAVQQLQDSAAGDQPIAEAAASNTAGEPLASGVSGSMPDAERQALEEKLAASGTRVTELEQEVEQLNSSINQTIKERSDRMKDTLNNKLKTTRAKMDEEFKKKEEDLQLRFEQERAIWRAENPEGQTAPGQPSARTTATAEQDEMPASTTANTQGPPDLSQLDDASVRSFLSTNVTAKSILSANLKKRLEAEVAKKQSEFDAKIVSAREQAQLMESKKSTLRINMAENKLRAATAKIGVVETAAKDTPQRPVGEVWEVAKVAQAAPAATPAAPATPATPARAAPSQGNNKPASTPAAAAAATQAPATPQPATVANATTGAATTDQKQSNPFAVGQEAGAAAPNPFAAGTPQGNGPQQTTQQHQQAPARSGIPMPRGGGRGRGRGGNYVPPGQRATSGNEEGAATAVATAPAGRGGRGGARGGRGGMNPSANDFQPGAKRPRGDSEVGAGAKRARGAH